MVGHDTHMGHPLQYAPAIAHSALTLTRVCRQSNTCAQREGDCIARKWNTTCMRTRKACSAEVHAHVQTNSRAARPAAPLKRREAHRGHNPDSLVRAC